MTWNIEHWEEYGADNQGVNNRHPIMVTWYSENSSGFFTTTLKGVAKWIKYTLELPFGACAVNWELWDKDLNKIKAQYSVDVENNQSKIKAKVISLKLFNGKNLFYSCNL